MHGQRKRGGSSGYQKLVLLLICIIAASWVWYSFHLIFGGGLQSSSASVAAVAFNTTPSATIHPGRFRPVELFFATDLLPENLQDYPCAETAIIVDGLQAAKTACVIDCERQPSCQPARDVCAAYVWCTHVILATQGVAYLKHADIDASQDRSDAKLRAMTLKVPKGVIDVTGGDASRGGGGMAAEGEGKQEVAKKRIYLIVSLSADSGDTLSDFLAVAVGPEYVQRVYRVFDPAPPAELEIIHEDVPRKALPIAQADRVRVVFMYDDPVNVLAAEYGRAYCRMLRKGLGQDGEGGRTDTCGAMLPSTIEALAVRDSDPLQLQRFYDAYLGGKTAMNYPVVAVNMQKVWDHPAVLLNALGLPAKPQWIAEFQRRTKVRRRVLHNNNLILPAVAAQLREGMFASIMRYIHENDAVSVVITTAK